MAANMYRVGDYVYFETSATGPYQIRRIEELTKTPTGNVEAKVMCFYRRRDIPNTLVSQADKHQGLEDDDESEVADSKPVEPNATQAQRHQAKHRELFLSRQIETLPATAIRGKCSVALLSDTECSLAYLTREDTFFYTLVYDVSQKTLTTDKGDIRVGSRYQAEVQPLLSDGESDGRDLSQLEELTWRPDNGLKDEDVEKFLLTARAVGTLARAVDACGAVRQSSLGLTAAAASRDSTLAQAHRLLHEANYNLADAFCRLVPDRQPLLCRDELEEWSASENLLFEEGVDKCGKDFHDVRRDYLPWKSATAMVEYFYMWKTTDRHMQQKRLKASEAERKLKQVYIPSYTKPNPSVLYTKQDVSRGCESCYSTNSTGHWFSWGPSHLTCRLCASCWSYWKRYGGLKSPTRLEKSTRTYKCAIANCDKEFKQRTQLVRHLETAHNIDEASLGQLSKAKGARSMMMRANCTTRLARWLCGDLLRLRRLARRPFDVKFDSRPALQHLPARVSAAKQLGRRPPQRRTSRRLDMADLLRRLCPGASGDAACDLLSRRTPSSIAPNMRRPFAADAGSLAEFHRRLDEHRQQSPASPQQARVNGTAANRSADEILLVGGKRRRLGLDTTLLRKAARRPFSPVSTPAKPNGEEAAQ